MTPLQAFLLSKTTAMSLYLITLAIRLITQDDKMRDKHGKVIEGRYCYCPPFTVRLKRALFCIWIVVFDATISISHAIGFESWTVGLMAYIFIVMMFFWFTKTIPKIIKDTRLSYDYEHATGFDEKAQRPILPEGVKVPMRLYIKNTWIIILAAVIEFAIILGYLRFIDI